MKRNLLRLGLSLIALFVMVVANAQTYQNEEASVSWPFNDANYATQYTKSPENGFSLVSVNTGDKEGKEEGRIEGKKEGKEEGRKEFALKLLAHNFPLDEIANLTDLSIEEIKKLEQ